ncbi:hypothetical protein CFC21_000563 [Triticum aestivum]|uniref:Uncharacterized protein n=1 Tax=Triticum aestivum TaxID=4565 RepID=A0A3B5XUH0_WHEAT|nr:uncharacterized protein LOC123082234 [Triticum aestivum]KAF6982131.1 hypothetical protein CFC21_000563 [Triticum aestivum]
MCSHSGGRRRCTATPAGPEARSPQPPGSNRRRLGYSGTTGAAIAPAARARRRIWQARVPHLRRLVFLSDQTDDEAPSDWKSRMWTRRIEPEAVGSKRTPSDWMSRMWKRMVKQSATSLNPGKYSVECPRNGKDMKVKDWRFFMWLDKYLDMVEEIWMINVLIMGNASARCVSREIQRRIDATRAENDATRA